MPNQIQTGASRVSFSKRSKSKPPKPAKTKAKGEIFNFIKTPLPPRKEPSGDVTEDVKNIHSVEPIKTYKG